MSDHNSDSSEENHQISAPSQNMDFTTVHSNQLILNNSLSSGRNALSSKSSQKSGLNLLHDNNENTSENFTNTPHIQNIENLDENEIEQNPLLKRENFNELNTHNYSELTNFDVPSHNNSYDFLINQ